MVVMVVVVVAIKADQGPIARGRCGRRWTERGGGGGGAWIGAAGDDHLSPLRASVTGNAGRGVVVVLVCACACGGGGVHAARSKRQQLTLRDCHIL